MVLNRKAQYSEVYCTCTIFFYIHFPAMQIYVTTTDYYVLGGLIDTCGNNIVYGTSKVKQMKMSQFLESTKNFIDQSNQVFLFLLSLYPAISLARTSFPLYLYALLYVSLSLFSQFLFNFYSNRKCQFYTKKNNNVVYICTEKTGAVISFFYATGSPKIQTYYWLNGQIIQEYTIVYNISHNNVVSWYNDLNLVLHHSVFVFRFMELLVMNYNFKF